MMFPSVVLQTQSSDEFYGLMSKACLEIQAGRQLSCEELMKVRNNSLIYALIWCLLLCNVTCPNMALDVIV